MSKALIIIDVQNFYFGENGLEGNVEASLKIKTVLDHFRRNNLLVFHVMHIKKDIDINDPIFAIHENVRPAEGETVIQKRTPGSFNGTDLLNELKERNVDEVVICGMMSHMCVDTTTREAFDLDFKCTVLHDACATRSLTFNGQTVPASHVHATSMAALAFAFARVISCDELMSEI
jgi:nicotinamidase-related amidase